MVVLWWSRVAEEWFFIIHLDANHHASICGRSTLGITFTWWYTLIKRKLKWQCAKVCTWNCGYIWLSSSWALFSKMGGGTRKCVCAGSRFFTFPLWTSSVFTSHGGLAIFLCFGSFPLITTCPPLLFLPSFFSLLLSFIYISHSFLLYSISQTQASWTRCTGKQFIPRCSPR